MTCNTDALRKKHYVNQRSREKEMNSGIKSLFLFVFAHKKYSRRLIYLTLSHCSHLDYINDLFNNFSGPASLGHLAAYGGVRQGSDFIKNILICVPKMKVLRGWNNMRVSNY